MKVREITSADRVAYRQLRETLDKESPMWGAGAGEREHLDDHAARQFDQLLEKPTSTIFVAEKQTALTGFLALDTSPWQSLARTTELMVGVLSAYQGLGIASQLFECAQLWAADKGIHRIELVVLSHNLSAIGLYKKLGYVEEGVRKQSSYLESQFVDEIYMAKLLK